MNKTARRNNATLFEMALIISKDTFTTATIKLGEVILSYGEMEIAITFDGGINEPQLVIIKNKNRYQWKLSIPSNEFICFEKLEAIASIILGVTRNHPAPSPTVSIPSRYLERLFETREIYLDSSFVITKSDKRKLFKIGTNGGDFSFAILGDRGPVQYSRIFLAPR